MSESRCPHCGKSSERLLADRWARLLGPDQLSLGESGVACPACGHGLRTETRAFGLPSRRVIAFAFLIAILGAGVYACLLAGPR